MVEVSDDRAAWLAQNVLPHEPALRAWLRRWPRLDLDIDDIVQETYAVLAARPSVAEVRNPKTYCFQTARSIVLMQLRRSRVVSILAVENVDRLDAATSDLTAEQELSRREEMDLLARAIAALPQPGRDALMLVAEGLSHREAGARLGISENAAQKHVAKSVHLLMDMFGQGGKSRVDASNGRPREKRSRHEGARD